MLELRVNDGTDDYWLELYENDPVNLKLQYADLEKIQAAVGSFSQSFRIPATQPNVNFFGTFFNANTQGGFNAKQKTEAELTYNTVPIIRGYIQLKQVFLQKETYADFQIVFFGHSLDLAKAVGDSKLADLDLSTYNHDLTYTNYSAALGGTLNSGAVRYGLMDKGRGWTNVYPSETLLNTDNPVELSDFVPCLRVRTIVEAIFDEAGFVLDSDFFDDSLFDDIYTPMFNGSRYPIPTIPLDEYKFNVGLNATESISVSEAGLVDMPGNFLDSGGDFYDPQSLYNTTTNIFSPTVSGEYQMTLRAHAENTTGSPINVLLYLYNATDSEVVGAAVDFAYMATGGTAELQGTVIRSLDSSKSYAHGIMFLTDGGGSCDLKTATIGTGWTLHKIEYPNSEQTVDMAANAPDIKQMDYLLSLQKMFNLVFVMDKLNPLKITVEPWNDYHTGGSTKDWTEYIDYSKDVVLKPTTDLQARNYEWKYSPGADFINKTYQEGGNRVFGRYLIEDGENDFSTSTKDVVPSFQACPTADIGNTLMRVHKPMDEKGELVKNPKCMVVFYSKLTTYHVTTNPNNLGGLYINNVGTTESEDDFPYIGHYSDINPDVDDIDLNFGPEIPTFPIEASPSDNLFNTYWQDYVNELYSSEARMMECHLKLTPMQVSDFEFSDRIWLKDSYWRVVNLSYSPNSETTVKATLIKILANIRACTWIPYSSSADGVITFQHENGTTGDPSEECCTQYGYNFVDGTCYQPGYEPEDNPVGVDFDPALPPAFEYIAAEDDVTAAFGQTVVAYASTQDFDVDLPDATEKFLGEITVIKVGSDYTITIDPDGSQTINGATTWKLKGEGDSVTLQSNGETGWVVKSSSHDAAMSVDNLIETSSNYRLELLDRGCFATGTITIDLPAVATVPVGKEYYVKNVGSGTVTVDPSGSEQIEGATTHSLSANKAIRFVNDGSAWEIISSY